MRSRTVSRRSSTGRASRQDRSRRDESEQQGCELYLDFEVDEANDVTLNGAGQAHASAAASVPAGIDHLEADLDESFADLDAALAAEEPEHDAPSPSPSRKKGLFRRRS